MNNTVFTLLYFYLLLLYILFIGTAQLKFSSSPDLDFVALNLETLGFSQCCSNCLLSVLECATAVHDV